MENVGRLVSCRFRGRADGVEHRIVPQVEVCRRSHKAIPGRWQLFRDVVSPNPAYRLQRPPF